MAYEALRDYLKESELRIVENLHFRMSSELAQKYDAGIYDLAISEQIGCIHELLALNLLPDNDKKFDVYLVPDDNFVKLLDYPYEDKKQGGRPVFLVDEFGKATFAYGSSQNLFVLKEKSDTLSHVMDLHEYAHLIQYKFTCKALLFNEGFAELVPWYLLDYENQTTKHINAVLNTDVYAASQILGTSDIFSDVVEKLPASFQKSYISSYIFIRTIIEKIQEKYHIDKIEATKLWLRWIQETKKNHEWLVVEFAEKLGLDAGKLLYTTDYQKELLQKIADNAKMKPAIEPLKTNPMGGMNR